MLEIESIVLLDIICFYLLLFLCFVKCLFYFLCFNIALTGVTEIDRHLPSPHPPLLLGPTDNFTKMLAGPFWDTLKKYMLYTQTA